MTTPLQKKKKAIKDGIKAQEKAKQEREASSEGKVVEMTTEAKTGVPTGEVEPHPQMPTQQSEMIASIVGKFLKTVLTDPMGYYVAIDFIPIANISRVSYNVIQDRLVLILGETTGRIGEQDIPIANAMGKKTGGMRREIIGQITSFKTSLDNQKDIRKFLEVYLDESPLTEETFEGFKHHAVAKEVLEKAAQLKKEEMEKKGKTSGLTDELGNPISSS